MVHIIHHLTTIIRGIMEVIPTSEIMDILMAERMLVTMALFTINTAGQGEVLVEYRIMETETIRWC